MTDLNELQIACVHVGPIATNCYILTNRKDPGEAVIVDPGGSGEQLIAYLKREEITPKTILLTHAHDDHTMAVADLKAAFPDAQVMIAESEARMVGDRSLNCGMFRDVKMYRVDRWLLNGEVLKLIGFDFHVIFTPGHTEGSACYYIEEAGVLIAGDTLFQGSYGRIDLPTGSGRQMMDSLKLLLTTLPEETEVLPGHGPSTTVGYEKMIEGFTN